MASKIAITITNSSVTAENVFRLQPYNGDKYKVCQRLERLLGEMCEGRSGQSMTVYVDGRDGVKAHGTLTLSSVVATDTCVVGTQTFTAVASGATGNQFNVGVSDTATATNLAAVINANTALKNVVTAGASGAVVTVTAAEVGNKGNMVQLTGSTDITASAAHLASGAEPTLNQYNFSGTI